MRYISAENQLALEQRRLIARDFVWFVAKRRDTGASVTEGLWSESRPFQYQDIGGAS